MEEEKQELMEAIYKLIEPKLKKRNLYYYMIGKLKENQNRILEVYEHQLLEKEVEKMRLAVELNFILKSYNRLVTFDITSYPIWLRALIWWDHSRWKRWWEQIKKRYKESRRR